MMSEYKIHIWVLIQLASRVLQPIGYLYPKSFFNPFFFFFSAFSSDDLSTGDPDPPLRILRLFRLKCELEAFRCGMC